MGDEVQQLSKDSADSAAAKKRVVRKRAKNGIKTATEALPSRKKVKNAAYAAGRI